MSPAILMNNNQGALALIKNPAKHIDIRYQFTRECYQNDQIVLDLHQIKQQISLPSLRKEAYYFDLSNFFLDMFRNLPSREVLIFSPIMCIYEITYNFSFQRIFQQYVYLRPVLCTNMFYPSVTDIKRSYLLYNGHMCEFNSMLN